MKARIPFQDLTRLHHSIRDELDEAVSRVVASSRFIGGPEVEAFEEEFARAHDLEHGVGCGSGTDALALALRALGVGPGDEVIVPGMTFVATAEAVVHVGATPVLADVDEDSLLLTPAVVDRARSERTVAVIPVHLYGHIVPFDFIDQWKAEGLHVIEDAAQAHIGTWKNEYVGSHGDAACFSFYPGKNLGAFGDGGMVLSRSESLVDEIRRLRDHGRDTKFLHEVPGWCSRLDGLQAAVLRTKLRHLQKWTSARRHLADLYETHLGSLLVPWEDGAVHHLLVARITNRDGAAAELTRHGVGNGIHYPMALSEHSWLNRWHGQLPKAANAAREVLSLPMDPLMTDEEVYESCSILRDTAVGSERR